MESRKVSLLYEEIRGKHRAKIENQCLLHTPVSVRLVRGIQGSL